MNIIHIIRATTSILVTGFSFPVIAQVQDKGEVSAVDSGQIQEILVTAQRRSENLQKVPIAVSAVSGQELQNRGITQVAELGASIPAMDISKGSGVLTPFLRGIGNSSYTIGNESSVAVYVDGVFYSRLPTSLFSLANVERVEVLKGPQGTLFGRNASGGVIQIITKDPSHTTSGRAGISYGRFNTFEGYAYATTGLSDTVAADISIAGRHMGDGWGKNVTTGGRSFFEDYFIAKSKILFEPNDTAKFTLNAFYGWNKGSTAANHYPGTTQGYSSPPRDIPTPPLSFWDSDLDYKNFARIAMWGVDFHAAFDLDFATLTSITNYNKSHGYQPSDTEFTSRPDAIADAYPGVKLLTQELQLASNSGSNVNWVAGAYYYRAISTVSVGLRSPSGVCTGCGSYVLGLDAFSRQDARSYAAYGQATLPVTDRLRLTGGVRYTHDKTDARGSTLLGVVVGPVRQLAGPPSTLTKNVVTFRGAIDYQLTNDVLLYASISRGYKAGVFNLITYNNIPNKAEEVDAYETGIKTSLFDRHVRLNVAGWWYTFRNPQTQTVSPITNTVIFANAREARSRGVEAELTVRATPALELRASGSYTDSRYTAYGTPLCNDPANACANKAAVIFVAPYGRVSPYTPVDATGNHTPRAPKWQTSLGANYTLELGSTKAIFSADWSYKGSYYFTPANDLRQPSYDIVNARVKFMPNEKVGFTVWGKNLTNAKYALRSNEYAGTNGSPYDPGPRCEYGVTLEYAF